MSFKVGDPVWARFDRPAAKNCRVSPGEYSATVESNAYANDKHCNGCKGYTRYRIYISVIGDAHACTCALRPRRDDYQQREGRVSMKGILAFLKESGEEVKKSEFVNAK